MSKGTENPDIWKDPNVVQALKDGRSADDICVISCPKCARWSYYNQGSHFTCRFCNKSWYCCSEGENPPNDRPYLWLDDVGVITLADTCDQDPDAP